MCLIDFAPFKYSLALHSVLEDVSLKTMRENTIEQHLPETSNALFDTESVKSIWSRKNISDAVLRAPLVPILFLLLWWCILVILEHFDLKIIQLSKVKDVRKSSIPSVGVLHIGILALSFYLLFTVVVIPMMGLTIYQGMTSFYLTVLFTCLVIPTASHAFPILQPISEFLKSTLLLVKKLIFPGHYQEPSAQAPVSFLEVLIADSLCSLSRVFYDLGMSFLFFLLPSLLMTSSENVVNLAHFVSVALSSLFAAIPFIIRIRQCLANRSALNDSSIQYRLNSFNIYKYISAFPPLILALLVSLGLQLNDYMIYFSLFHSIYGYFWDCLFDWGVWNLLTSTTGQSHHLPYAYLYLAVVINAFLKFAWAFQEISLFSVSPWGVVFILEIIEILRRFIWILFRVDYEFGRRIKLLANGGRDEEAATPQDVKD